MIVLDASVVNIALPSIQTDRGFSSANLPWVINAYVVAFGGLLLLGGRAGDLLGRRRMFMAGVGLFTLASLLGGMAQGQAWLLRGQALQGIGAAIVAPTALALIDDVSGGTTTQPRLRRLRRNVRGGRRDRPHSGRCAHRGVVAVDAVHQHPDRHPAHRVGTPDSWASPRRSASLRPARRAGEPAVWSRWSTALPTPPRHEWTSPTTIALLVAGVGLLVTFLVIESRVEHPLLPMRILADLASGRELRHDAHHRRGAVLHLLFHQPFRPAGPGIRPIAG